MSESLLVQVQIEAKLLHDQIEKFPSIVESYLKAANVAPTRLGLEALGPGQGDFVRLMRNKRDFRGSSMKRVLAHICGISRDKLVE